MGEDLRPFYGPRLGPSLVLPHSVGATLSHRASRWSIWTLLAALILVPISQVPAWTGALPVKIALFALLLPSLVHALRAERHLMANRTVLALFLGFLLYAVFCATIIGGNHRNSYFIYPIFSSFIFYLIGLGFPLAASDQVVSRLLLAYVFAALVPAWMVYTGYFNNFHAWMNTTEYLYGSKNSLGALLGAAVLIALTLARNTLRRHRLLLWVFAGVFVLLLLMTQCRSAILGLFLAFFLIHLRWRGRFVVLAAMLLVGFFAEGGMLMDLFHKVAYRGTQGADLGSLSSGRVELIHAALDSIKRNWLLGTGSYYVDCMPVSIVAEWGLAAFIPLAALGLAFTRTLFSSRRTLPRMSDQLATALTLLFGVIALFEGIQPFGPGATTFLLWFITGMTHQKDLLS